MIDLKAASGQLNTAGIDLNGDFHSLRSTQVGVLLELARQAGYKQPRSANGSTARSFFEALPRKHRAANKRKATP